MDLDAFFDGHEDSKAIFDALQRAMDALSTTTMSVGKSQIAFRRGKAFAWAGFLLSTSVASMPRWYSPSHCATGIRPPAGRK